MPARCPFRKSLTWSGAVSPCGVTIGLAANLRNGHLVRKDPGQIDFKNDLALTYNNLTILTDSAVEKRALFEQALPIRKQLVEQAPTSSFFRRNLARTYELHGLNQFDLGHTKDALSSLQESRLLLQQVVVEQPAVTIYQDSLAGACESLGTILAKLGHHREAKEVFEQARTICRKLVHSNPDEAGLKESLMRVERGLAESEKALKAALTGSSGTPERP
jgi:tetratricopeptide (TPR) repeat protein